MTLDQFQNMVPMGTGIVVECQTVQERRNVLELFEEIGVRISLTSREHLLVAAEEDHDTTYMHPGIEPGAQSVVCFRDFERAKRIVGKAISYHDIRDLIENPPSLDDRSDTEFASDFASLLC